MSRALFNAVNPIQARFSTRHQKISLTHYISRPFASLIRFQSPLFQCCQEPFKRKHSFFPAGYLSSARVLTTKSVPPWHNPSFMEGTSVKDKEDWLESMLQKKSTRLVWGSAEPHMDVDVTAYLVVLKALGVSRDRGAPLRAEQWIKRLEQHAALNPSAVHLQPTTACYNAVMESWAKSTEPRSLAVIRAERWLTKLKVEGSKIGIGPNTESFNAFLDVCSRGRGGGRGGRRSDQTILLEHAQKAESTLRFMIEQHNLLGEQSPCIPNTDSFHFVMRAWVRCTKESTMVPRVLEIIKQMETYQRNDPENSPVRLTAKSYCMVMQAWAIAGEQRSRKSQRRDSQGRYREDSSQAGLEELKQVEAVLLHMHELHDQGDKDMAPNTVAYNTLIGAWARLSGATHRGAPLQTENLLKRMIELRDSGCTELAPDYLSYLKVIQAWAKVRNGIRAEQWLRALLDAYKETGDERLRPLVDAYNMVMKGWVAQGNITAAERLILELIDKEKEGMTSLRPDSESFSIMIHAWLNCDRNPSYRLSAKYGCRSALQWLDEVMGREEAGTFEVSAAPEHFTCILKSAAKCAHLGGVDTLDLAIATLDMGRASRYKIDFKAYVWLLEIGLRTLSRPQDQDARTGFLTQLVRDCCNDGLMSNMFLRTLANSPVYKDGWTVVESQRLIDEFFVEWPLPQEWTRNIPKRDFLPRSSDVIRTNNHVTVRDRKSGSS